MEQKHSGGLYTLYKFYDGLGQLIQSVAYNATVNSSSRDIIADTEYDAYGRVIKQQAPYDPTKWNGSGSPFRAQSFSSTLTTVTTYDKYGRVTKVVSPTASEDVDYAYTTDLTTVTQNARGYNTTTIYDIWGRVKEVHPPSDPWLRYTYDGADHLTKVEKMTGSGTIFGTTLLNPVDALGRKWSMSDMDMGAWSYRYDALGNLTSQIDARTCTTALVYDSLSRLTSKSYSGTCGTTTTAITYGYDATTPAGNKGVGNRTGMSDGSGSTTWEYGDNRGRLTKETKTISGSGSYITQGPTTAVTR